MCREGGGKGSPGVITLMNPGPYWPLYLWGFHLGGSQTIRPLPRGGSSRPKVTRLVRYGPVRQKKNFSIYKLMRRVTLVVATCVAAFGLLGVAGRRIRRGIESDRWRAHAMVVEAMCDRAPRVEDDRPARTPQRPTSGATKPWSPKRSKTRVQTEQDHEHSRRSRENPFRIPRYLVRSPTAVTGLSIRFP